MNRSPPKIWAELGRELASDLLLLSRGGWQGDCRELTSDLLLLSRGGWHKVYGVKGC